MEGKSSRLYTLKGLDCARCALEIEQTLHEEGGLEYTSVNFATSSLVLDPADVGRVRTILAAHYPEIELREAGKEGGRPAGALREFFKEQRDELLRIFVASVLLVLGLVFEQRLHHSAFNYLEYPIYLAAYLTAGSNVLRKAFRNARRGKFSDENSLMSIATIASIAIHQLPEAVAVMLFYYIGETLQDHAVERSRRSISALMDVRPELARVKRGSELQIVQPDEIGVGELIVVQPGERIPLDGEITEGESFVDTSALTGEPVPRRMAKGGSVFAGMICTSGILTIRVTQPASESSIMRLLRLVEESAGRKARIEQTITVFSRYYTPVVIALAVCVAAIPPLLLPGASFSSWLHRALVLLVISCPCALMVSVPLGYFGGIGGASRRGILVKGANFLEALAKVDTMAFDKTGTLTEGTFRVTCTQPRNGFTGEGLLEAAAQVESLSPHPIAASILEAYGKEIDRGELGEYQEIAGHGVKGRYNGRTIIAGNDRLMHREGIPHDEAVCGIGGTVVHVAVDGVYAGYLGIADEIRPGAARALRELRAQGVRRIIMLTGDDRDTAEIVGRELGIDLVCAGLLPGDKVGRVEALAAGSRTARARLAFVGDGLNDAPALARADLGIAMGGLGVQAAIEAADVVIMDDRLEKLPLAVKIARRTRSIVVQNIAFALGTKAIFAVLGVFGVASIWEAVFADVGVSLLAVINAARALNLGSPPRDTRQEREEG